MCFVTQSSHFFLSFVELNASRRMLLSDFRRVLAAGDTYVYARLSDGMYVRVDDTNGVRVAPAANRASDVTVVAEDGAASGSSGVFRLTVNVGASGFNDESALAISWLDTCTAEVQTVNGTVVGRCKFTHIASCVASAWLQHSKLKCDKLV